MKIISQINNDTIKKAAELVVKHHKDQHFLTSIKHESFKHTGDSGSIVSTKILLCDKTFYVIPYTHWNPFSATLGHFENPNYIVNMRKINALTLKERVANIFHECLGHGLDYSHKGNRVNAYNLETVPYKASQIFIDHLTELGIL